MASYENTKPGLGDVYPEGGKDTSWQRTEPLITPDKLVSRHLFGIPLVSGTKNPLTGKAEIMTLEHLMDYIDRAAGTAELETGLTIFPTKYEAKLPYDRPEYLSFGYFRLEPRPIASIESLTVNLSDNHDIYQVPLDWIETANLYRGQINIIPLTLALVNGGNQMATTTAGGATMLALLGNGHWIASFWKVSATIGFPNGLLPKVLNDLIGTIAAMEVLSMLASTYGKNSSASLSIDGMSQSVSGPGPQIFVTRMEELEKKRIMLVNKLKKLYGLKLFSGNV